MQIYVTIISLFDLSGVTISFDVRKLFLFVCHQILSHTRMSLEMFPDLPLALEIYLMQHVFPCNGEKR